MGILASLPSIHDPVGCFVQEQESAIIGTRLLNDVELISELEPILQSWYLSKKATSLPSHAIADKIDDGPGALKFGGRGSKDSLPLLGSLLQVGGPSLQFVVDLEIGDQAHVRRDELVEAFVRRANFLRETARNEGLHRCQPGDKENGKTQPTASERTHRLWILG